MQESSWRTRHHHKHVALRFDGTDRLHPADCHFDDKAQDRVIQPVRLAVTVVRCFASARCGGVTSRFTIATRFLPLTAFCCFARPLTAVTCCTLLPRPSAAFVSRPDALLTGFPALVAGEGGGSLPAERVGAALAAPPRADRPLRLPRPAVVDAAALPRPRPRRLGPSAGSFPEPADAPLPPALPEGNTDVRSLAGENNVRPNRSTA